MVVCPRFGSRRYIALVTAIMVSYCGFGLLGLKLALLPGDVTAVWIPAGIALAATLRWGVSIWPGILLGSFGISVFTNPSPLSLSIGIVTAVGNTLAPLIGMQLILQVTKTRYPLKRSPQIFQLVAFGGILAQGISATIGVLSLCVGGWVTWNLFGSAWLTWWISNLAGVLIFTPLLLTWKRPPQTLLLGSPSNRRSFSLEIISWGLLFCLVGSLAFWYGHPVEYLIIPLLVWAAFRFSEQGTTLAIAVTGLTAIAGTVLERSSFIRDDFTQSLLFLESYIGVVSVTTLVLMAVLQERRRATAQLKQAKAELETRVMERTQELSIANEALQRKEIRLQEKANSLAQALRELQQTQIQLIQSEKMTSLGQLVAGIAHEINNPVSFIYSNLTPAKDYVQDLLDLIDLYSEKYPDSDPDIIDFIETVDLDFLKEDIFKLLDSMKSGADRIHRIVLSLRNFSRLDEAELKWVDIHAGIDSTLLILQHRLDGFYSDHLDRTVPPITVIKDYGTVPDVECYAGEINQVFMNILSNAIDALGRLDGDEPRTIHITTAIRGDRVTIAIADNGPGISPANQTSIFDPFFTTKPVGQGTGLGLYTSYEMVVKNHHGALTCDTTPGAGACFTLELPLTQTMRSPLTEA